MTRKYEYSPSDSTNLENRTKPEGIPRRGVLVAAGAAALGRALSACAGKQGGSEATPTPKKTPAIATAPPETTPASETTPTLNPDFIKNNTDVFEWAQ